VIFRSSPDPDVPLFDEAQQPKTTLISVSIRNKKQRLEVV
jgi:hypothetical protein